MKWITNLFKALAIVKIVVNDFPEIVKDGKVTMDEAFVVLKNILAVFGWDLYIKLPEEFNYIDFNVDKK